MVTVTKREAVQALIRGAMRAVREGDDVCGLTLAGAAEGAMPDAEDVTAFEIMRAIRIVVTRSTEKAAGTALNIERNWLKHYSKDEPAVMDVEGGNLMLLRAVSRYAAVYGFDELTAEVREHFGLPAFQSMP